MSARRRIPLSVTISVGLTLAAVVLWSAGWLFAASEAESAFNAWRAEVAREGATLTCVEETAGGYPFRLRFDCRDAVIEARIGNETYVVTARSLRAVALAYDPEHVIVELDGPSAIARRGAESVTVASAESGVTRASVELADGSLQRFSLVFPPFVSLIPAGGGTDARVSLVESAIYLRARPEAGAHDLAIKGSDLTIVLPEANGGDEIKVDTLDLIAVVDKIPETGLGDATTLLERWRDAGGVADVQRLSFDSDNLMAEAEGTVALDASGRIEGSLNCSFGKLEKFIAILERRGTITRNEAQLSVGAVGIFGSASNKSSVSLPTRIREGKIYLGPVQVAALPPLI